MSDLLAGATWLTIATPAGKVTHPDDLPTEDWVPSTVPGTAASAMAAHGSRADALARDYDSEDWWFATSVVIGADGDRHRLTFEGVATHWEAWWDQTMVASGRSMFRAGHADLDLSVGEHRLVIRCPALASVPTPRRPRAQWRSNLVSPVSMRWHRTAGLGHIPWTGTAPLVGPWRPVTLTPLPGVVVSRVATHLGEEGGVIDLHLLATGSERHVVVEVDGRTRAAQVTPGGGSVRVVVPGAQPWWPHTHGTPHHHHLVVRVGEQVVLDRLVGFRTVTVDTEGGGFRLALNGRPVFARGACWVPPEPLSPVADSQLTRRALIRLRDAGANLVRVTGTTTWQDRTFHDTCVRLGLMVWQDAMLHTLPPVEEAEWLADLGAEVRENLLPLQGQPHLVVACGGSETEQQPVLWGLDAEAGRTTAIDQTIPEAIRRTLPDVVQVPSSPSGGFRATAVSQGISHYFGVGAYERPLSDARTARVRFTSECLAFGVPAERPLVREVFGQATTRVDRAWRLGIAKDPRADWDFEQTAAHYARTSLGLDVEQLRSNGRTEEALDALRAAASYAMESAMTEWRSPDSTCAGAVVLSSQDLTPGAGWGLTDSTGAAKSSWWAMRRAWAPRTVLLADEGLDGVVVHVVNDLDRTWRGTLELSLSPLRGEVETVRRAIQVKPHSSVTTWAEELLGGFRDLTHAWRFGPPAYDGLGVVFRDEDGEETVRAMALPGVSDARPDSVHTTLEQTERGWQLRLRTDRTATFVVVECPGWLPADNWFHLPRGRSRTLRLHRDPAQATEATTTPCGSVRALNAEESTF